MLAAGAGALSFFVIASVSCHDNYLKCIYRVIHLTCIMSLSTAGSNSEGGVTRRTEIGPELTRDLDIPAAIVASLRSLGANVITDR